MQKWKRTRRMATATAKSLEKWKRKKKAKTNETWKQAKKLPEGAAWERTSQDREQK